MANILYGVSGEGLGHAIRSKVIIKHLQKSHNINIVASNKAYNYLSKYFNNIHKIHGLKIKYKKNKVKIITTILINLKLKKGLATVKQVSDLIKTNKPDLIISDYEASTAKLSSLLKIPLICIGNHHINSNTRIEYPIKYLKDFELLKKLNSFIIPKSAYHYIITTYFYPEIIKDKTTLTQPVLRPEIIKAIPKKGKHILVYQTSDTNTKLFDILKQIKEECIIYGFDANKKENNLTFKTFNEKEFINDLSSCKAVITNGGFTLISEALFFKKPVFSIPIKNHFEQICNALYIERLGYGKFEEENNLKSLNSFLSNLDFYNKNLKKYNQKDNKLIFKKLDSLINEIILNK